MTRWLDRFLAALQFLSVVTLRRRLAVDAGDLSAAMAFYPLVGLLLGLFLAGANWLLGLALPALCRAVVVVGLWAAATRFLHLDGLADCADGFWGAYEPSRVREIMHDSRMGVFGAAAIFLVLMLKTAVVFHLGAGFAGALVAAPVWGRLAMVLIAAVLPAGGGGLGERVASGVGPAHVVWAMAVAGAAGAVSAGAGGVIAGAAGVGVALIFGAYARHRLGYVTGDVMGGGGELAEAAALLTGVAVGLGAGVGV